ncbi:hypothetical protein [Embleya scabrispora]|uniref:hypothetical protein n=1 Tax=Embleya scabrispora TaxID=159449 RepID=UPI000362F08F|nr:hypothetical protein [Embleya scabrispora]MYS85974.1 hypothetical protein [Streptomyces sp. SID5474]
MTTRFGELDDREVPPALCGLIGGFLYWEPGALAGIERIGGYLAGTADPLPGRDAPERVGAGQWTGFIGRTGAIALRAAAPSTRPERRERLLALLEMWADSVFVDPTVRMRTGTVREPQRGAVRDERGATILVCHLRGGIRVLEARTGDAEPPGLGPLEEVEELPRAGWGNARQIRDLVALVRARGPMPWDPEAVVRLAADTGMSRGAAALALAGTPGTDMFRKPFLDAEERRLLGLKAAEAETARVESGRLEAEGWLDLLADVLPADPADLWAPDAPRHLAARIATAWHARNGLRAPIPETSRALIAAQKPKLPAAELCEALAHSAADPLLAEDLDTWPESPPDSGIHLVDATGFGEAPRRMQNLLEDLAALVPTVYAELPAGDPIREGLPTLVRNVRARLDHPGLLLSCCHLYHGATIDDLRAWFGPHPYDGPEPLTVPAFDDGLTVAVEAAPPSYYGRHRHHPRLFFRPAVLGDDARAQRLDDTRGYGGAALLTSVRRLRGDHFTRIVARVESGALPVGAYEANPAASVPDVVERAAKALGLAPDPAALYLQLLALEAPTDRGVRTWNAWTPTRHRKAVATLVDAGLAVADKRARAGRGVFLPGPWAPADRPYRPMETWKAAFLGVTVLRHSGEVHGRVVLDRTLPELFADAWASVERGEGPQ